MGPRGALAAGSGALGAVCGATKPMSTMMIAIVPIGWAALAVGSGIWRPASRDA